MGKRILSQLEFEALFETFNTMVYDNKYNKLNYNTWRDLKSIKGEVNLYDGFSSQYIRLESDSFNYCGDGLTLNFRSDDKSFGQFLKENVFNFDIEENLIIKNEKENEKMKGFNFDFGPCTNDAVRISMYGIAVKNVAGTWVSYNPANDEIIDVDVFNFEGGKYMYKIPVAIKDIKVGDVVIHNRIPVFVTEVSEDFSSVIVVDIRAGERKEVIPTKNMFGFNFITKVVSLFDAFENAPTPEAPFGNMLPFLMMGDDNKDIDPMMMMLMMNTNGGKDFFSNPMMMYFMLKDNKDSDMLPLMFLMNSNK